MSKSVSSKLDVALRKASRFADHLISSGIHPSGSNEPDPATCAASLADVLFEDSDEKRFREIMDLIDHAYVLGIAVGLRLRVDMIGGAR